MNYTEIRKLSLKVFIGFLVLTALIAIGSILSGSFGDTQLRILATTFTISVASICMMSSVAFIEKRKLTILGFTGVILALTGAIFMIFGIWFESIKYLQFTITLIVSAIAFAHAFLLYLPKFDGKQKIAQIISSIFIGVLSIQIIVAVWLDIYDDALYYRLMGVVAIIVGFMTLIIPILVKLRKGDDRKEELLILRKLEGEKYKDSDGKVYIVKEINIENKTE